MKKLLLIAAVATTMSSPVNAQQSSYHFDNASYLTSAQKSYSRGLSMGLTYTYRFGVQKEEEYGSLNLKNFRGKNIPVLNFSSEGSRAPQWLLNSVDNGDGVGSGGVNWMMVAGGVAIIGAVLLLSNNNIGHNTACLPDPNNPMSCQN